jgi:hypothetical protein
MSDDPLCPLCGGTGHIPAADPGPRLQGHGAARTVEFLGQHFRISSRVGMMPVMDLAAAAASDSDTSDMDALAAVWHLLRDCIAEDEWHRFRAHAIAVKADVTELLPVTKRVAEMLAAG